MSRGASRCWAVVPAAGSGSRMAAQLPKQYLQLAGATVLEHSLRALLACEQVVGAVVALPAGDSHAATLPLIHANKAIQLVTGGAQRSASVLAALDALAAQAAAGDWVLVHDAARPCVRSRDVAGLIAQVMARGIGGILAEPVVDTLKRATAQGLVAATLDRDRLWRAQTPQMFRLGELRQALRDAAKAGRRITDEAAAMEIAGYPVQLVAGSPGNFKITVAADLERAAWYLDKCEERETKVETPCP